MAWILLVFYLAWARDGITSQVVQIPMQNKSMCEVAKEKFDKDFAQSAIMFNKTSNPMETTAPGQEQSFCIQTNSMN